MVAGGAGGASTGSALGVGLGTAGLGSLISYGLNASAASTAWDRQKNLMTRSAQYARINLEDAGFNPIYALGGGQSFLSAGGAKAPQAAPAQDVLKGAQLALVNSAVEANTANAAKAMADADYAKARSDKTRAEIPPLEALATGYSNLSPEEYAAAANDLVRAQRFPRGVLSDVTNFLIEAYSNNQAGFEVGLQRVIDSVVERFTGDASSVSEAGKRALQRQALRDVIRNPNATGAMKYGAARMLKDMGEDIDPSQYGPFKYRYGDE